MNGITNQQFEFNYIFSDNQWYHAVIIIDPANNNCSLYVNGTLQVSPGCNGATTIFDANYPITLGIVPGQTKYFDGKIDELLIFNKTITQTQINQLYNNGTGASYPTVSSNTFTNRSCTVGDYTRTHKCLLLAQDQLSFKEDQCVYISCENKALVESTLKSLEK